MKSGIRLRFLDNVTCKEIRFTSPPKFCDFEYQKDQHVPESFIRKGLKDFAKDLIRMKEIYNTPVDSFDPYLWYKDNYVDRFTKFAQLRKEFSEGVPIQRPIFCGSDSDFLIGSGRCLIIGTYFKDMKIDIVKVNEKKFTESNKKIYDFIYSFENKSKDFLLYVEKSDFIDAYKLIDILFEKLDDCVIDNGSVRDPWHGHPSLRDPNMLLFERKIRKIIKSTNIDNIKQLYDVLDEISLLSVQ